jgi:hypothetical protein
MYKCKRLNIKIKFTGWQKIVFQSLSQVVQGKMSVNEAKKNRNAQAIMTL